MDGRDGLLAPICKWNIISTEDYCVIQYSYLSRNIFYEWIQKNKYILYFFRWRNYKSWNYSHTSPTTVPVWYSPIPNGLVHQKCSFNLVLQLRTVKSFRYYFKNYSYRHYHHPCDYRYLILELTSFHCLFSGLRFGVFIYADTSTEIKWITHWLPKECLDYWSKSRSLNPIH